MLVNPECYQICHHQSILTPLCLQLAKDLLHPSADEERRKCKLKRLVQHPNSYFMDVKCPGQHFAMELLICLNILLTQFWFNFAMFLQQFSVNSMLLDLRLCGCKITPYFTCPGWPDGQQQRRQAIHDVLEYQLFIVLLHIICLLISLIPMQEQIMYYVIFPFNS